MSSVMAVSVRTGVLCSAPQDMDRLRSTLVVPFPLTITRTTVPDVPLEPITVLTSPSIHDGDVVVG